MVERHWLIERVVMAAVPDVLLLAAAAGLVLALALLLRGPALAVGFVDEPDHRKQHGCAVPLTGGVAVAVVVMIAMQLFVADPQWRHVLVAAMGLLAVGILDDCIGLSVTVRLLSQIVAASWLVAGGLVVYSVGAFGELDLMAKPFTVLCIVTLINACNMVDGADGLLAGVLVPACIAIALVSDGSVHAVAVLTGGALAGFLVTNWPAPRAGRRAGWRTFLGNGGVQFVAVVVAALLVEVTQHGGPLPAGAVPFLVLIPLADLANSCARRLASGMATTRADNRHLHHRLLAAGLSHRRLASAYAITASLAGGTALALVRHFGNDVVLWSLAAVLLTAVTFVGVKLPPLRATKPAAVGDVSTEPSTAGAPDVR